MDNLSPAEALGEAELPDAPADLPSARPARQVAWLARLAPYAAVSAGGMLGADARFWVGAWVAARWGTAFPWGTLLINVTGSFLLGFYLTLVTERFAGRPTTRLFVATGFCGAYTTFSTFSFEAVTLIQGGSASLAIVYLAASLFLGLAAVVAGGRLARAL
jgi:CrcB protein